MMCECVYAATVIMPTQQMDTADVIENHDGTVTLKYQPKVAGQHEMLIKCNGAHITGW
jgi:filamin